MGYMMYVIWNAREDIYNNIMFHKKKTFYNGMRTPLPMKLSECRINFLSQQQQNQLKTYAQNDRTPKMRQGLRQLLEYRLKGDEDMDLMQNECVQGQDALRLMNMICGGYVQDDFVSHLSYNDFQEKKQSFGILRGIYQNIQKKYKNRKIEEGKIRFRSMLLMVYLEENVSKMSRVKVEEIFTRNRIVW